MIALCCGSRSWRRGAGAAVAVLVVLAVSACSTVERVISFGATDALSAPLLLPPDQAATASCIGVLAPDPAGAPPPLLPQPPGATPMRAVPAALSGAEGTYTEFLQGSPGAVARVFGGLLGALRAQQFVIGVDPPARWRASASFTGPLAGSVLVQPLCRGYLAIRIVEHARATPALQLGDPVTDATRSCARLSLKGDATGTPPGLVLPEGATPLTPAVTSGAAQWTAFLAAGPSAVPDVFGALVVRLRRAGFVVGVNPRTPDAASASFTGPTSGSLLVQPLCRNLLAVRYVGSAESSGVETIPLLPPSAAVRASCSRRLAADPAGAPPAPLPLPAGTTPMPVGIDRAYGRVYTGFLAAHVDQIVDLRGALVASLRAAGEVVGEDPAGPASATASFSGELVGTLIVQPLCQNHLAIRYVLSPDITDVPPIVAATQSCARWVHRDPSAGSPPERITVPGLTVLQVRRVTGGVRQYDGLLRGHLTQVAATAQDVAATLRGQSVHAAVRLYQPGAAGVFFSGPVAGVIEIQPLCSGYLLLRYRVRP